MNALRYKSFLTGKNTPPIMMLPSTDDAAVQHVRRAHLQAILWKAAEDTNPPPVNIQQYGWKTADSKPEPEYGIREIAPKELLKVVACSCKAATACLHNSCSCKKDGLSCTTYCKCEALEGKCHNHHTKFDLDIVEENIQDVSDADTSDVES
jgi:hypothetical protein